MKASNGSLSFTNRPTATAPGHWVLAQAGKRVLRPGGLQLTRAMLGRCSLGGKEVVELAPGLGRTAREILKTHPRSYTGVDQDTSAVAHVNRIVEPAGGVCRQGDAAATGLEDGVAETVIGEAMLTMQSPRGKSEIIKEAVRLLRPGGTYGIHELALTPDDIDPEVGTDISRSLARAIHVNARPLTVAQWRELFTEHGLTVEWTSTAPMALLKLGRNLADEGVLGVARIAKNLVMKPELRRRVLAMRKNFIEHADSLCGVALVARKPK